MGWLDWYRLGLIACGFFRSITLGWWGLETGGVAITLLKVLCVEEFNLVFRFNVNEFFNHCNRF